MGGLRRSGQSGRRCLSRKESRLETDRYDERASEGSNSANARWAAAAQSAVAARGTIVWALAVIVNLTKVESPIAATGRSLRIHENMIHPAPIITRCRKCYGLCDAAGTSDGNEGEMMMSDAIRSWCDSEKRDGDDARPLTRSKPSQHSVHVQWYPTLKS